MRKLLLVTLLLVAGALAVRRLRPRPAVAPGPLPTSPLPPFRVAEPEPAAPAMRAPAPATPPPTTSGERVLLMSISSLAGRGQEATAEAVLAHVAAGEIDPDEGTIEALLQRMAGSGLLTGGDGAGPFRLTETGRAALLDGSAARPSPAGGAADELSAPGTTA
jgi:hypothetical protein